MFSPLNSVVQVILTHLNFTFKRIIHLPPHLECCKPSIRSIKASDAGKLVQLSGKVTKVAPSLAFESRKQYLCTKCKQDFWVTADFETCNNALVSPTICPLRGNGLCDGNKFNEVPGGTALTDYQEVKIQESTSGLKVGALPRSLLIKCENDLVDKCMPGDDVLVVGTLIPQWQTVREDLECEICMALKANSIRVINSDEYLNWDGVDTEGSKSSREELAKEFSLFWENDLNKKSPIAARNFICGGICPKLYGMLPIKLALLLILIGGSPSQQEHTLIFDRSKEETNNPLSNSKTPAQFCVGDRHSFNASNKQNVKVTASKFDKRKQSCDRRRTQPHMLLVGDPGKNAYYCDVMPIVCFKLLINVQGPASHNF